jgi:hypothetical protein
MGPRPARPGILRRMRRGDSAARCAARPVALERHQLQSLPRRNFLLMGPADRALALIEIARARPIVRSKRKARGDRVVDALRTLDESHRRSHRDRVGHPHCAQPALPEHARCERRGHLEGRPVDPRWKGPGAPSRADGPGSRGWTDQHHVGRPIRLVLDEQIVALPQLRVGSTGR